MKNIIHYGCLFVCAKFDGQLWIIELQSLWQVPTS
jgi:hypothetical protein